MTTIHKNLTGADLHEPKGADTATSGQVYVSDGAGSGVWTTATSIITNTAFTTGDVKLTLKTTADTSWILHTEGGTIGDGSSGATIRANADTSALFTFYYNGFSNTICPVSGGRGANAATDFAAHKTLTIPAMSGRSLTIAGTGSGLTARALMTGYGAETVSLTASLIPTITGTVSTTSSLSTWFRGSGIVSTTTGTSGVNFDALNSGSGVLGSVAASGTFTSTNTGGSSPSHANVHPIVGINAMIKL